MRIKLPVKGGAESASAAMYETGCSTPQLPRLPTRRTAVEEAPGFCTSAKDPTKRELQSP